jgi:glycosyltransferase involved in cell wall biosynthesis
MKVADSLNVNVVIPTYKTRDTIFRLLASLEKQSYKDFNVMVVYKKWEGYKDTLSEIKAYDKLDINFIEQDKGLFEEALNTIYRKADGDIVIHTDDDAYASKNWVKDHIELHKKHKEVGIATGLVEENTFPDGTPLPFFKRFIRSQQWRMNKHTIIDRPIDEKFKNYGMYIGRSGMLVDTGRKYNMIRTFKQHGVNMSWKQDALYGFKLPCYTKQGGRNEAAAALEVLDRGYSPIWFGRGTIHHPLQKSDSRGVAIKSLPEELTAESVIFSYYVSKTKKYKVDLALLKKRTMLLDNTLSHFFTFGKNKGYRIGYNITQEAILHKWSPQRVRNALIKALSHERSTI